MAKRVYTLTPLTGIHIGTGEELTPLDYKVAQKTGSDGKIVSHIGGTANLKDLRYFKFSSDRILQKILEHKDQKQIAAFERASVNGNMKELQQFFQENCNDIKDTDYFCGITKGFLRTYNENCKKDLRQNAAKVLQMYHPEGTPYPVIPGSSLKGSIRTALLNGYLADLPERDSMLNDFDRNEKNVQQKLLKYSDAKNDPLRAVSISDCSFKLTDTQLVGGLKLVSFNKQTESLDSIGTQIQAEAIRGELLGGKAITELCISIDEKFQETTRFKKIISLDDIHESCNNFYWSEFQKEYDTFYKNIYDETKELELIVKLRERLKQTVNTPGQFIIRVGRWSQVEFVTFGENFRKPKTKKDRYGKPLGYGGTRTLLDFDGQYVPMGWCILKVKEE
ncbi:MAG: type III-A CRISPR-associated RAMP protein Csm5 [Lachnoclostridium sp.]|jgi:CRISPR-associated protein Csm5|nr:type III-A CRISPR-associated RAMP protein Csm5 [Lachnoclostridium sp.]